MNKSTIKNFAIWARRKLISDITYKAGLLGINEKGISEPLPISTDNIQFFDIGTGKPTEIANDEIKQRKALVTHIKEKESTSDYKTAYQYVVEEVAYTWFNRLIAIRFMEVNDYLPSRVRVLSSHIQGKSEPDIVTTPYDTDMEFSAYEQDRVMQLKDENKLDELFRMLFIKQCNKLNEVLPGLFEKTSDYTELLLNISFTDQEGIVNHLINDIYEKDFTEAVEIIGWLYQYYNTEPKDEVFAKFSENIKVTKEGIPAATQLFTPDWIVRYMVENSLGRLWLEGHYSETLKSKWDYYLNDVEQTENITFKLNKLREIYEQYNPMDIKIIDPCMGSGHILVYVFDVLMQIYESQGFTQKDAVVSIIENNIHGLDIDDRAYQLAYFSLMMKARKYDRRFLSRDISPKVFSVKESNNILQFHLKYLGHSLSDLDRIKAVKEIKEVLKYVKDAKEYGSLLWLENINFDSLKIFLNDLNLEGQIELESIGAEITRIELLEIVEVCKMMINEYDIVITNPPYMKADNMSSNLNDYVLSYKPAAKYDLYSAFIYRCYDYLKPNGIMAMITMHNFMFSPSFVELRDSVKRWDWINMIHLGSRAFSEISGEVVQTAAYTISKSFTGRNMYVIDVTEEKNSEKKETLFLDSKRNGYSFNLKNIDSIPGHAFGYALSDRVIELYNNNQHLGNFGVGKAGVVTGADNEFIRFWHEVNYYDITFNPEFEELYDYVLFSKGGTFSRWYGNSQNVLKLKDMWDDDKTNESVRRGDKSFYYKKGIGWSQMGGGVNKSYSEIKNSVCKTTTPMFYVNDDRHYNYILGFLNSSIPPVILKALNPTLSILISDILNLPFLYDSKHEHEDEIVKLVNFCYSLSKKLYVQNEENWEFEVNPLIGGEKLSLCYDNHVKENEKIEKEIKYYSGKLNEIFISIMGLRDRLEIAETASFILSRKDSIKRLISYYIGCVFGRYFLTHKGIAYAGGQWDSSKYESFIPDSDNCVPITDEEYFEDDIVGRFVEFVKVVYGKETLEENLDFIANALGGKGDTSREVIRNYFIKDFFKDHVKTYKKRPIYWLYDSGKQNGFKALIYMHRYTADTTGIARVDYLHKMQKIYMGEIDRMQDTIENSSHAREVAQAEKRKEKLIKQLKETKEYDEKIAHIALSRIDIDLDDGVKGNYDKVQTAQDGKKLNILGKI